MRCFCLLLCVIAGLTAALMASPPKAALAHVGSSRTVNNRYYKLAPMADRVRVVYTIFYGEEPSLAIRQGIDRDHDGLLSQAEVAAFASTLRSELFASVIGHLNGEPATILWDPIDIGIGEASTRGGSFSADLVGTICLAEADANAQHKVTFIDRMNIALPGETELRLDPAPGIEVTASVLGGRDVGLRGHKWQGGPGPAADGYALAFTVRTAESAGLDTRCEPAPKRQSKAAWIAGLGAFALLVAGAIWRLRRRSRVRR